MKLAEKIFDWIAEGVAESLNLRIVSAMKVLELKEKDHIIFMYPGFLGESKVAFIKAAKKRWPLHNISILEDGMTMGLLRESSCSEEWDDQSMDNIGETDASEVCADCGCVIGKDAGPPDGWQLEDGRTVCHSCSVADFKEKFSAGYLRGTMKESSKGSMSAKRKAYWGCVMLALFVLFVSVECFSAFITGAIVLAGLDDE